MTFTKLLAILNEKCPMYEVGHDTGAKVLFGDKGGYIDWCGLHFGFDFGSDMAQYYLDGQWVTLRNERQLNRVLATMGGK